jgi:hypothetical protein
MSFKQRTYRDWYDFVLSNPWKLSIVPKNMITVDMLKETVQQDGTVLEIIRVRNLEHMSTNEIYELAVQNKGSSIEFVPENCITDRMCHNAIFGSQGSGENLKFIPNTLKSKDFCKEAVIQSLYNILYVPSEHITNEMLLMLIDENIDLLYEVDLNNMTLETAKYAIKNGFDSEKLPKHIKLN